MLMACKSVMVVLAVAGLLLAGCGGQAKPYVPPLEGGFTWQDGTASQDLEGGTVEFESGGTTVATGIRPDGTFMLADAPPCRRPPRSASCRRRPSSKKPAVLDPRYQSLRQVGTDLYGHTDTGPQQAEF